MEALSSTSSASGICSQCCSPATVVTASSVMLLAQNSLPLRMAGHPFPRKH